MLAPFLSVVFHRILCTLLFFFKLLVCACFEKVLLRDNPCISPQECDEVVFENCLEQCLCEKVFILSKYLRFLTTRKRHVRFRFL